jgi:hypothetical protein
MAEWTIKMGWDMIYVSNMGGTQVLKPGANCEYFFSGHIYQL